MKNELEISTSPYGFCCLLNKFSFMGQSINLLDLEELFNYLPKYPYRYSYWFSPYNKQIRLDILDKCILECTEKIKK